MFCVFNIESKSPRQLFYTPNQIIEPLILQKHQTGNIAPFIPQTEKEDSLEFCISGFWKNWQDEWSLAMLADRLCLDKYLETPTKQVAYPIYPTVTSLYFHDKNDIYDFISEKVDPLNKSKKCLYDIFKLR